MSVWAVVPLKHADRAKSRLSRLLDDRERLALFEAMAADVLSALARSAAIAATLVVTEDARLARLAAAHGAGCLWAPCGRATLNRAVRRGARHLRARGIDRMLVVDGDLPRVTAGELDAVAERLARSATPTLVLGPDSAGEGTNVLGCSLPCPVRFAFGEESFRRHLAAAGAVGVEAMVVRHAGIAADVDSPADLLALEGAPCPGARTRALVRELAPGRRRRGSGGDAGRPVGRAQDRVDAG